MRRFLVGLMVPRAFPAFDHHQLVAIGRTWMILIEQAAIFFLSGVLVGALANVMNSLRLPGLSFSQPITNCMAPSPSASREFMGPDPS